MKRKVLVVAVFALFVVGLALFVPQAKADQCSTFVSTFDFFTNTFHVPCFNLQSKSYWVDMEFMQSQIAVKAFGVIGSENADPGCAFFDSATSTFYIPCASVMGDNYWIDLLLVNPAPNYLFQIKEYDTISAPGYGNPAPGY